MFKAKIIRQTVAGNSVGTLSWKLKEILGQLCDTQETPACLIMTLRT